LILIIIINILSIWRTCSEWTAKFENKTEVMIDDGTGKVQIWRVEDFSKVSFCLIRQMRINQMIVISKPLFRSKSLLKTTVNSTLPTHILFSTRTFLLPHILFSTHIHTLSHSHSHCHSLSSF
jgi:hypothetical protein